MLIERNRGTLYRESSSFTHANVIQTKAMASERVGDSSSTPPITTPDTDHGHLNKQVVGILNE